MWGSEDMTGSGNSEDRDNIGSTSGNGSASNNGKRDNETDGGVGSSGHDASNASKGATSSTGSYDLLDDSWDIPDLTFPEPSGSSAAADSGHEGTDHNAIPDLGSLASGTSNESMPATAVAKSTEPKAATEPKADAESADESVMTASADETTPTAAPTMTPESEHSAESAPAAETAAPAEPVFASNDANGTGDIPDTLKSDLSADTEVIGNLPQELDHLSATLDDFSTPIAAAGDVEEGATTPVAPAFAPTGNVRETAEPTTVVAPGEHVAAEAGTEQPAAAGSGASSETVVMPKISPATEATANNNGGKRGGNPRTSHPGKGGVKQRKRRLHMIIAAVAAIVLVIAGTLVWKYVSDNQAHSTAMMDCSASASAYDKAKKQLDTAIKNAQDEATTAAGDVSDATTVSTLKQTISDSNISGQVRDCRNSMPTSELQAATDANSKLAAAASKAAKNVNAAAKKVSTSKDAQKTNALKQQITALLPGAQTAYEDSDGVVDDVTRATLKSAIDEAQKVEKKSGATVAELEKAKSALETAKTNVEDSMPSEESTAGSGSGSSSSGSSSTRRRSSSGSSSNGSSSNGSNSSNGNGSGSSSNNRYSGNGYYNRRQYSNQSDGGSNSQTQGNTNSTQGNTTTQQGQQGDQNSTQSGQSGQGGNGGSGNSGNQSNSGNSGSTQTGGNQGSSNTTQGNTGTSTQSNQQ